MYPLAHWQYTISRITQKNCSNKHVSHPKGGWLDPIQLVMSALVNYSHQEENLQ